MSSLYYENPRYNVFLDVDADAAVMLYHKYVEALNSGSIAALYVFKEYTHSSYSEKLHKKIRKYTLIVITSTRQLNMKEVIDIIKKLPNAKK